MGRRKTIAELREALEEAQRREQARATRRVERNRAYRSRGAQTSAFYRSMLRERGNDRAIFQISVDSNTVAAPAGAGTQQQSILTVEQAGLLGTLTEGSGVLVGPIRGSGTKPTKISWYFGNSTAEVEWTPWRTRWIRFYDEGPGGQSHRSTPFSRATGDIDVGGLRTAFSALFGPTGTVRQRALGDKGKATLTFENAPIKL